MKLEIAPQDVSVNGDFSTSTFNIGEVGFIVDLLADKIYTDKPLAVVREYCCNAHDAHVEAGTTDIPFEVHLPTMLEPWFSVRDFGIGLSEEDVRGIFSGIGISTKRNSNELIGCFGVGTLSGFSIADSFTVTSYFNGLRTVYSCYRDDKRQPVVARLVSSETDEPNGIEVKISVDGRVSEFEKAAIKVFKFWEGTTPKINDKEIIAHCKNELEDLIFVGEDFGLSHKYGQMYALQGNIAYKIPYELDEFNCYGYLKFDLGELEFDTARENLSVTSKVKEKISQKFKLVKSKLVDIAVDQVEQQPTKFTKAVLADKLSQGQVGRFVGDALKSYALPKVETSITYWKSRYRGCETYKTEFIPIGDNVEYYVYKDRMTSRIRSYIKDTGATVVVFKNLQQAIDCGLDIDVIKDLNDLPKVQREKNSTNRQVVKTFKFNQGARYGNHWIETNLEISNDEIVYVELHRLSVITKNNKISGGPIVIAQTMGALKEHGIVVPELYGLRSAFLRSKQFKSGNFISLDDYVVREFSKLADGAVYHKYSESDLSKVRVINDYFYCDEASEIVQGEPSCQLGVILKNIGLEVPTDTSFGELVSEFLDKYSMLTILSEWEIRNNKDKVAKYLDCKEK